MLPLLVWGAVTVVVETPVLMAGLARRHPWRDRLLAGVWLSACTWPVVAFILPPFFDQATLRGWYLPAAESFAVVAECLLFQAAFGARAGERPTWLRDSAAILAANVISFLIGLVLTPA